MATKDFNISENSDHRNKSLPPEEKEGKQPVEKKSSSSEIKNAHATGDGSFGRNESSLPDKEEKEQGNATY